MPDVGRHGSGDEAQPDLRVGRGMLERRSECPKDARLGCGHLPQGPAGGPGEPSDRDRRRRPIGGVGRLDRDPGIQGAERRFDERRRLAVRLDLPGERSAARDDPELDPGPADAPGVEAAPRAGMDRPDAFDREARVGVDPRGQGDDEPDRLRRGRAVVRALAGDGHESGDEGSREQEPERRGRLGRERHEPAKDRPEVEDHGRTGSTRSGSTGTPALQISRCRCGPVVLPVRPTRPITSPATTDSPTPTAGSTSR